MNKRIISELFKTFLLLSDAALKRLIDKYNEGKLTPEARHVMEMIDALVS